MSANALDEVCPKCKQIPGFPCIDPENGGRETATPHSSRIRKANGRARRHPEPPAILNEIADVVLAHKSKPKAKAARKRIRRAKRHAQAHVS